MLNRLKQNISKLSNKAKLHLVSNPEDARMQALINGLNLAPKLYGRKKLKLNLGCAGDIRIGFVNIDSYGEGFVHSQRPEGAECVLYNLVKNLPVDNESTDYIYSSHFFEHIEYHQLKHLLAECYRVMAPHGTIRVAMPNFPKLLKAYMERDPSFYNELVDIRNEKEFRMPIDEVKWADIVSLGLYEWGEHKYFYDPEKFIDMLERAGFKEVNEVAFDETIDLAFRRPHSFYVTGKKH